MVGTKEPRLEQGRDAMDTWHHFMDGLPALADGSHLVPVALGAQRPVPLPGAGVNRRIGHDSPFDEARGGRTRGVWNRVELDLPRAVPVFLGSSCHEGLRQCHPSPGRGICLE